MNESKMARAGWAAAELKARDPAPASTSIKRQKRAAKRGAKARVTESDIGRPLESWILVTDAEKVANVSTVDGRWWFATCVGQPSKCSDSKRGAQILARSMLSRAELDATKPRPADDSRTGTWRLEEDPPRCELCRRIDVDLYSDMSMGVRCQRRAACDAIRTLEKLSSADLSEVLAAFE